MVAIAENPHGLRQAGDFYTALVKDPRFTSKVNDIVVEFASRRSQPVIDQYLAGKKVSQEELQHVWRDSTKIMSWDSPIYEGLLSAVRGVNKTLPLARRVRILAGDSPIDWEKVHTHADWDATQPNNNSFALVIMNEVLGQHRKALVILGSNHLTKGGDVWGDPDTTTLVEGKYPGSMLIILMAGRIFTLPSDRDRTAMASWKAPSVVVLKGTWLGSASVAMAGRTFLELGDALLYLGPKDSLVEARPNLEAFDAAYVKELARRNKIVYECDFDEKRFRAGLRPCQ